MKIAGALSGRGEPITEDLSNSLCDADIHLFGLTVTWPEKAKPSAVEGTWLMTEQSVDYDVARLAVPKGWAMFGPDGLDLLVIRKDRVCMDFVSDGSIVGAKGNRVIVLEAE